MIKQTATVLNTKTIQDQNNKVAVSGFGGQIISWEINGTPIIFENKGNAITDGKSAYRGGAPICFPYFGKGVLLASDKNRHPEITPQHGASRTSSWEIQNIKDSSVTVHTLQPYPDSSIDNNLSLSLCYSIESTDKGGILKITGTVENIGLVETLWQLAVHSYWNCEDPGKIKISGLGNKYLDNLEGLNLKEEAEFNNSFPKSLDRVYLEPANCIELVTEDYILKITSRTLNQAIVWNPGTEHTLKDLAKPDFICVESAVVHPAPSLKPNSKQQFEVTYHVTIL